MKPLTDRQKQVCGLLRLGCKDSEIASLMGITEHGVNFHLRRIFSKFRVHSRVEAALAYGRYTTRASRDNGRKKSDTVTA